MHYTHSSHTLYTYVYSFDTLYTFVMNITQTSVYHKQAHIRGALAGPQATAQPRARRVRSVCVRVCVRARVFK